MDEIDLENDVERIFEPEIEDQETAIRVWRLHKRYRHFNRTKIVLNGLNLKCPAGKLYVLYGTGKSGKSAVVKSILNIESFSSGAVILFNKTFENYAGNIGYMPQNIGLDPHLTIIESINYFAGLLKLHRHECVKVFVVYHEGEGQVNSNLTFGRIFLDFSAMQSPVTINDFSTFVENLNENQRKVVSFYIATMASPKIVILDQPLAGCDPLYKRFFWQTLRNMVDNDRTTILMTCSDEIDVKYADTIGYLRNGQIIIEESPNDLMQRYNIWNFNDLVLSISVAELKQFQVDAAAAQIKDNISIKSGGFDVTHFTANDSLEVEATEKIVLSRSFCDSPRSRNCYQSFDMNDVKHILMQLLVLIRWQALVSGRNYLKVIFHLLLPTLCVLFYGFSVGNDMTEVNLGVVFCGNNTNPCDAAGEPPICEFERQISKTYLTKTYFKTYEIAAQYLDRGTVDAVLLINTNPMMAFNESSNFGCQSNVFTTTNVVLEVDATSKLVRSHIIDQLSRAYGGSQDYPLIDVVTLSQSTNANPIECLKNCPVTPFVSNFKYPKTAKHQSQVMHLIWGAVVTISHFYGAIMGALPLCTQNRNGLIDRMKLMEITQYKIQIAHWFTRTLFILAQNFLLLVSAIIFLKVELLAYGFFCGWFAIILQTLCGFSFGILLYAILKKQVPVIMSLIVVELIVSSLSGFFWNYHGLTMLFQKLTIVLPHHSVSKLLFEVLVHGKIVVHNNVWVGFLSPLFWMISTLVIYCVYTQS